MRITNDHELMVFDWAYRLGFRAGQLDWRQHIIDGHYRIKAEAAGAWIALQRSNISLEEYTQLERGIKDDAPLDKPA